MTDAERRFKQGDVVFHPRRPEWGEGIVSQATTVTHDGRRAQRVVVDFSNRGRVTINTAVAPLATKEMFSTMSRTMATHGVGGAGSTGRGWLADLERGSNNENELWRLPDEVGDPFMNEAARLKATLDLWRFSTEPRALIDWAIGQTGLSDPLSRYTRHELELGFEGFARNRETHLRELVKTLKRQGQHHLIDDARQAIRHRGAKVMLEKVLRG